MDNVVSDSPPAGATYPFTVNEELSFEDAWVRVAELLQCAVATSQVLGEPLAAADRGGRAVECL